MKNRINLQSVVLGLLLGISVTLLVGASGKEKQAQQLGRYQIGGTGNHGMVLDTQTGKVWSYYFQSNGGTRSGDFFSEKNK